VVLTGRNRSRPTAMARAPSNTSIAAPMALSSWITLGEAGSVGSTVFTLRMSGSPSSPRRATRASRSCARSNHRLFAWK